MNARVLAVAALLAASPAVARAAEPAAQVLKIPGGEQGIGLDDYFYDEALGRLVLPAGRTGTVQLVDPATKSFEPIDGFAAPTRSLGMVRGGPTSADSGDGRLFVTDRTDRRLYVVDGAAKKILFTARLAEGPDYVRYVAPVREVWVTEPRAERIEAFTLGDGGQPGHAGFIQSKRGEYEALVVDAERGRAYSNQGSVTAVLDLKSRAPAAFWPNGCQGAEGLALDAKRGFLMVACGEGRVNVLDAAHGGKRLSGLKAGAGVDIIAYRESDGTLYIPSAKAATLTVAHLSGMGKLTAVKTVPSVAGGHCAAADAKGVYVCDGKAGALLYFEDSAR